MRHGHITPSFEASPGQVDDGIEQARRYVEEQLWADIFETNWLETENFELRNTLIQGD